MTGPSNPRGERAGTRGADWETELRPTGERWVPDGHPEPTANRAARRAAARKAVRAIRDRPLQADLPFPALTASRRRPNPPPASIARSEPLSASPTPESENRSQT